MTSKSNGNWLKRKWLVLWSLWAARLVRQPTDVIRVSGGLLRGAIAPDGAYTQYSGIYYATVNLENRFQAPGPEMVWDGVYDAIHEHIQCVQPVYPDWLIGRRQCLVLNVYTPLNTVPEGRLPVMFYIHGGAFIQGSGNPLLYGPRYLVSKGVVLVTINYRLNVEGFVCLGIKEAPGNAAMKDMVAALRWVQRNIKQFGGDPDNVTIFGQSAGGASVSYLLLSPTAKGLFHKAIAQSGSSLAAWTFQYNPVRLASYLAKVTGLETMDPLEIYKHFMTKTDRELHLTRVPRKEGHIIGSEIIYTPCAEKIIDGVEPFLTKLPYDVFSSGIYNKVPMIIGATIQEGVMLMNMDNDTMLEKVRIEKSLPKNLDIPFEDRAEVVKKLNELYFDGKEDSIDAAPNYTIWAGEAYMNYPSLHETELILKTSDQPVYNYMLKHDGWRNLPKIFVRKRYKVLAGATHADDLFYIFSQEWLPSLFESTTIERITTMWTNFAKYGEPTPEVTELLPLKWLPTNSSAPTALVIDQEFSTEPLWYNDRVKYLMNLYSKYRKKLQNEYV